ncbi:serine O-acetyltransferase [Arthrobacter globiformis]|uniref:serine O-acetyltransferase n=1 Tax=Arthrobacter globiformis TaxID=1665 RepID=UPI0035900F81
MSLIFYRVGHYFHVHHIPVLPRVCTLLGRLLFGAHIPSECSIGRQCKVAYGGSGVVIHPNATIGHGCTISPGVVIGGRGGSPVLPTIGDDVKIFPGAAILGSVVIGNNAVIGANAVVVADVPAGGRVVAPAARMLPPRGDA